MARKVQGKTYTWQISDTPIGSGDAGEVYAVSCVEQPDLEGVLKKPARIATGGTIQRQAGQIAKESLALARLNGLPDGKAHPPRLLDQANDFTKGTVNFFIISETAPGDNLETLLAQTRQNGKPFPRRVIISVLDALFDLFSRAHKAGVLWNDIKLEHIYWNNSTGEISVIDWGNAIFLDNDEGHPQKNLPRWEDYRQMIDTLGGFLQQSAPELYVELGWDEFKSLDLDSLRISVLARRISYQQQLVSLQVMEYQSLIRVLLNNDPSMVGLQKIKIYKQILEKIGAPWEHDRVLKYIQSLILFLIAKNDISNSIRATTILWDLYDESLDLHWHLLREYFRNPDIIQHHALAPLVKHTMNDTWTGALWEAIIIGRDIQNPPWWEQLTPVLRQKALGENSPPPRQTCQSLLDWANSKEPQNSSLSLSLKEILINWRTKGEDLKESPLDYTLLDLVREDPDLPRKIRSEIKMSFTAGEQPIRDLMKAWTITDLENLSETFQQIAAWDPDRWGLIRLAEIVEEFKSWKTLFFEGPEYQENISKFLQQMIAERPPVERLLGSPPWFNALNKLLLSISRGDSITHQTAAQKEWCPWLLKYPDLQTMDARLLAEDDAETLIILTHFAQHLQNWSDLEAGLGAVRNGAPSHYPITKKLADGFNNVLSLNFDPGIIEAVRNSPLHPALAESQRILAEIADWRLKIAEGEIGHAIEMLNQPWVQRWKIAQHLLNETQRWQEEVNPQLVAIKNFKLNPEDQDNNNHQPILSEIAKFCADLYQTWTNVYQVGIHQSLLEVIERDVENAHNGFYIWRRSIEQSNNRAEQVLYHSHLDLIRQISEVLLRLSQHIRQARLSYIMLSERENSSLTMQFHAGENLLDHLSAIEDIIISDPTKRHFPKWKKEFREIQYTKNNEKRQQVVLSFSDHHPLHRWLIESTLQQ